MAILKGILESSNDEVNLVNAPLIAGQHGNALVESKLSWSRDFASAISNPCVGSDERYSLGSVLPGDQPPTVRPADFLQ